MLPLPAALLPSAHCHCPPYCCRLHVLPLTAPLLRLHAARTAHTTAAYHCATTCVLPLPALPAPQLPPECCRCPWRCCRLRAATARPTAAACMLPLPVPLLPPGRCPHGPHHSCRLCAATARATAAACIMQPLSVPLLPPAGCHPHRFCRLCATTACITAAACGADMPQALCREPAPLS